MQVATPLDQALIETQRRVRHELVPEGESHWAHAHGEWEKGWVRITPHLTDAELEDRYKAVGTILSELKMHFDEPADPPSPHRMATRIVAERAILNARLTLAYYLRGAPLPPACFPGSYETIELLGQGDPNQLAPDAPLRRWLRSRGPSLALARSAPFGAESDSHVDVELAASTVGASLAATITEAQERVRRYRQGGEEGQGGEYE
jgi:hypothetical protein